jgi:hypothetical protein
VEKKARVPFMTPEHSITTKYAGLSRKRRFGGLQNIHAGSAKRAIFT